jgi:hypothetical protein
MGQDGYLGKIACSGCNAGIASLPIRQLFCTPHYRKIANATNHPTISSVAVFTIPLFNQKRPN